MPRKIPGCGCWKIREIEAKDTAYETVCCTRRAKYYSSVTRIFRLPSRKLKSSSLRLKNGADVAIGSRWLQSELQTQRQSLHRQLFGRVFNLLLRMILGLSFKDTQCGFKAFTRRAAETIFPLQSIERWGFDPELLYLAKRFKLKVVEVPVAWAHCEGTRINPLRDGAKMFLEMLKIRWNALRGKYGASRNIGFTKPLGSLRNLGPAGWVEEIECSEEVARLCALPFGAAGSGTH